MSAVCPICGYNQGEERILVSHLIGVHGGIPHAEGEELFVCQTHPSAQPMNHLEFIKHTQEVSANVRPGQPKPLSCQPIGVIQGQVASVPLKNWHELATKDSRQIGKYLRSRAIRLLVFAILFLGLGIFNFATYTSVTSYQSTFSLQPGLAYDLPAQLNPSDTISGTFQENSGNPISLYILTSAQFASYQAGNLFSYLYSVTDVAAGSFSYTVNAQDTYYLFFSHGAGLRNNIETVFTVRSYTTHVSYRLFLGIFFIAVAAVESYFAYRLSRRAASASSTAPTTVSV
jgi:hypothetical protein